jgi:hypothetical protein
MGVRGGAWWRWIAGAAGGLAVAALGGFLFRAGLEDADRWASVFGLFLNLAGLAVAVYSLVRSRPVAPASVSDGDVTNEITGGEFGGPLIMGRNVSDGAADGTMPGPAPGGDVSNTIGGGRFHGPTIMGRDIRGVALPPAGERAGGSPPDRASEQRDRQ